MSSLVSKIKNSASELIYSLEFNSTLDCWVLDQGSFKRACKMIGSPLYDFIGDNKDSFGLFGISIDVSTGYITYSGYRISVNFYA